MSDHIGPEVAAQVARRVERHPYADHPAALVLADHYIARLNPVRTPTAPIGCACGWTGPSCNHPAHLTEMLDQAGLLKEDT